MIKAVIFDYFGVISSDEYWNLVKTDKDITSDWLNVANRVNLGKLHWRDFMQTVADKTNQTYEQVQNLYSSESLNPEVLALAKELHQEYQTGIITNAHHEFLEPIMQKANLKDIFDVIVISSREGVIKPDARIFEITLERLGRAPDEVVFIDDIERNIVGAKAVGLKAIHYQSFEQLKMELRDLL